MSYAMYTEQGDALVEAVVVRARQNQWTWAMTLAALVQLSRNHPDVAGEATDTAVRECVYSAIGAYERDEDFYV
jgi:hypothetical protein